MIFSRSLNVTGITIDEPQITLLRSKAGQWNYASLGGTSTKAGFAPSGQPGSSSSMAASVMVGVLKLRGGKAVIGSTTSKKRSLYDDVDITATDLSLNTRFPVELSASLPGGGKLKLDGHVGPVNGADSSLTPIDAKLHISDLNLASTGFLDPSLGLGRIVNLDSTLASRDGQTAAQGTLRISDALLVAGGAPAGVPVTIDFSTRYDLRRNSGLLNSSIVKIGNARARLNGTYISHGDITVVDLKLTGDGMPARDVEAFLPAIGVHLPKGASLTAGTLDVSLNIKGPTDRLVTDGTLALSNGKLAGFNLGSKMSAISALAGIDTGSDLTIEKLTTTLHIARDGLRVAGLNVLVPSLGFLVGTGTIDAKNLLDFKMLAKLHGPPSSATGSATIAGSLGGLLGQVTGSGKGGVGMNIPFLIQGTTSDPKFVPDVGGLAIEILKAQAGSTGATTPGAQQQNENPLGALGNLLQKKKKP